MPLMMLFPLAFAAGIGVLSWRHAAQARTAWRAASERLGLAADVDGLFSRWALVGEVGGLPVRIDKHTTGSGDSRTVWTRYVVHHPPVGPPVKFSRQRALSRIRQWFGGDDVVIGDPFFDDEVIVDTPHAAAVREFLTPARQAAIMAILGSWSEAELTHASIQVMTRNLEVDPSQMVSTIRRLADTAEVMGDPDRLNTILENRDAGNLAEAAADLHLLNEGVSNVFTQGLEAEVHTELGDRQQAATIYDDLAALAPDDRVSKGWADLARTPPPPRTPPVLVALRPPPAGSPDAAIPPPPGAPLSPGTQQPPAAASSERVEVPAPEPAKEPSDSPSHDRQAVVDDLFAAGRMSFEIVEHFERTYQHDRVRWSGEVAAATTYLYDPDFGEGPGVKATVLLGTAGTSDFISNEVHAVIQLPDTTPPERGARVTFEGTLNHVDRFSRKIWLSDGLLV